MQGANLAAYGEEFGSLNADVNLTGREVQVSRLVDREAAAGQAWPHHRRPAAITSIAAPTPPICMSEGVRLLGLQLPGGETIRGDVQLAAMGMGSVDSPAGTADVTFDGLEIERPASESSVGAGSNGAADPDGAPQVTQVGRVVINAVAENKEATIKATAERFNTNADAIVALARPWATKVTVRAENLDIATLPGLPANGTYEGQLRATVEASGDLVAPEKGMATATIESFTGAWNGRPFTIMSSAPLQYADERLTIEGLEVEASGSTLTVKGELPLTDRAGEGELAVDLHGNIATLTQYLPADTPVAGDGELTLTGTLTGTLKALDPDLALTVKNGLILSRYLEPGFSNVQLQAKVADGASDDREPDRQLGRGDVRGDRPHSAGSRTAAARRDSADGRSVNVQGGRARAEPGGDSWRAADAQRRRDAPGRSVCHASRSRRARRHHLVPRAGAHVPSARAWRRSKSRRSRSRPVRPRSSSWS